MWMSTWTRVLAGVTPPKAGVQGLWCWGLAADAPGAWDRGGVPRI